MEILSDRQAGILVPSYSKRNEMKSSSSVAGNGRVIIHPFTAMGNKGHPVQPSGIRGWISRVNESVCPCCWMLMDSESSLACLLGPKQFSDRLTEAEQKDRKHYSSICCECICSSNCMALALLTVEINRIDMEFKQTLQAIWFGRKWNAMRAC